MTKYLILKHYRSEKSPSDLPEFEPGQSAPPWDPADWDAHVGYMRDFADRLRESGEFVAEAALVFDGVWVQYDAPGKPPITDGPFAETKDVVAGWMMIDVDSYDRALELTAELSAAPGPGGAPLREWLELRQVMGASPMTAE